ncbi:hypothetical protein LCGC14_1800690 [marine sediment metagenome]|uniref:HNH nuclease domain-containing protein n=1 Tax=marine sediment metagenome TaxID=412755 RepID=A0A0F9J4J7_9ZZZZ
MTRMRRHSAGYLLVPDGNRGIYEHRYVMEKLLGRKLSGNEHVHHKDGNKGNNHPSNLQVLSVQEHRRLHRQTQCKVGHVLKDSNVYVRPDNGKRNCLLCIRRRARGNRKHKRDLLRVWRRRNPEKIAEYNLRRNRERREERRIARGFR